MCQESIINIIRNNPGIYQKDIGIRCNLAKNTVSFQLKQLRKWGLVKYKYEKNMCKWFLNNKEE